MDPIFTHDPNTGYPLNRTRILVEYRNSIFDHLKRVYPTAPDERLETFIKDMIRSRLQVPQANISHHPRYGVTNKKTVPLTDFVGLIGDNILTPNGGIYVPPSKNPSVLKKALEDNVKRRSDFKHLQLEAAGRGDTVAEQMNKLKQASAKIFNNSIPGAFGFPGSFLFDLVNYNATTSVGRICVMTGYSHVEKMITGNIFVTSLDDILHYCSVANKYCPKDKINKIHTKYNLYYPTSDEVALWLLDNLKKYRKVPSDIENKIYSYTRNCLSKEELSYIYYGNVLIHFLVKNSDVCRQYFDNFFRKDVTPHEGNPKDLFKVKDDIRSMAIPLNFDLIGNNGDFEKAVDLHPDGAKQLTGICHHMENCLEDWRDVFEVYFKVDYRSPKTMFHPAMVRNCVLLSDTDSVFYTTDSIVKWYCLNELFTEKTYAITMFTVFIIGRTLKHIFFLMTRDLGVETPDRPKIDMKNEWYYPVLIRTSRRKHYAGLQAIQEGKILPKPKSDIKGVGFRGSTLPEPTREASKEFILETIDELMKKETIDAAWLMDKTANHEKTIYMSLMNGEKTYLNTGQVKEKGSYKDFMISNYFYWMLWDEVFSGKFGSFVIPNKGYIIKVGEKGTLSKSPEWLNELKTFDEDVYNKYVRFIEQYPKKKITQFILPGGLSEIPTIFRSLINYRDIIFKNCSPFYMFLQSFGISFNDAKTQYLVSDFYGSSDLIKGPGEEDDTEE